MEEWGGGYPLAGVPALDIAAGQAHGTSGRPATRRWPWALDNCEAAPLAGGACAASAAVTVSHRSRSAAAGLGAPIAEYERPELAKPVPLMRTQIVWF
jgi:hypothetical protein